MMRSQSWSRPGIVRCTRGGVHAGLLLREDRVGKRSLSIRDHLTILGGAVVLVAASSSMLESGLLAVVGSALVLAVIGLGYRRVVLPLEKLVDRTCSAVLGETDHIELSGPSEFVEMAAPTRRCAPTGT